MSEPYQAGGRPEGSSGGSSKQEPPKKAAQEKEWRTPGEEMESHSFAPPPPEATNVVHPASPGENKPIPGEGVVSEVDAGAQTHSKSGAGPAAGPGARRIEALNPPTTEIPAPAGAGEPFETPTVEKPGVPSMDTGIESPAPPRQEARREPGQARTVGEAMTVDVEVCSPNTELYYVARMMAERDIGAIPVVESTDTMRPAGIITDRDIVVRVIGKRQDPNALRVEDCMSTGLVTVGPEMDLQECVRIMEERQVRRAPVVDRTGRLVGIIAQADLVASVAPTEAGELVREISEPTRPGAQGMYH